MIETHGTSMTSAHYSRMGYEECDKIHKASIEILERIGIDVHDEKAIQILVAGGATADGIRVRIPEYMVAKALSTAPKTITLYDRNGKVAMRARDYNTYYGGGSDCLNILDHRTGERRKTPIPLCGRSLCVSHTFKGIKEKRRHPVGGISTPISTTARPR